MGGEAVHGAVDAIKASYDSVKSFDECIDTEMNIFLELLSNSAQGRARRHAFFAERVATGLAPGAPAPSSPLPNKVGVIGAGTMGAGIATCFLRAGYDVTLVDVNAEGLARGEKIVQANLSQDVKRGRATQERAEKVRRWWERTVRVTSHRSNSSFFPNPHPQPKSPAEPIHDDHQHQSL
jgi:3-hydroxyacyl-CoA dehydrogenase